jgi:hypothetical protein
MGFLLYIFINTLSSVEEHSPSKRVVTGSNPVEYTRWNSSMVEQEFHELLVIGSSPISMRIN